MRTIENVNIFGKKVLLRVDFNVPLAEGTVTDDTRIRAALPTINYLLERGARLILISHLGRPAGCGFEPEFSLAPAARVLGRILNREIALAPLPPNKQTKKMAHALTDRDLMMLENVRFDAREQENSAQLAAELATLADIYVNDAFGVAHRAHASVEAITHQLPAYAGLLLEQEVVTLRAMMARPAQPFLAVLGGAKVADKIKLVEALLKSVDSLIIGGAMCFAFLVAQGHQVGCSRLEVEQVSTAEKLLAQAADHNVRLLLPLDFVVAAQATADTDTRVRAVDEMDADMMGLDIGPATISLFTQTIDRAATLFWNGPMGMFELEPFAEGTRRITQAIAANRQADTIIGGGDSVAAARRFGQLPNFSFVSTGGGAALRLIEGDPLPALTALG
ncbi:MAG: phosphoglycerate kinase [Coriobacteriales bacterium]|nr:phosphoglycerate kinase [Coriobacteriales bacterium]